MPTQKTPDVTIRELRGHERPWYDAAAALERNLSPPIGLMGNLPSALEAYVKGEYTYQQTASFNPQTIGALAAQAKGTLTDLMKGTRGDEILNRVKSVVPTLDKMLDAYADETGNSKLKKQPQPRFSDLRRRAAYMPPSN